MSTKMDLIRKLLAQAEGTNHEAEAATFLAKAQQLMTDYGIDEAEARAANPSHTNEIGRSTINLPGKQSLVKAKRALLSFIAQNNCCEVLIYPDKTLEVVGYPQDRARTELLFNSLLIQMEKAIRQQTRTDIVYRNNFAWGYAVRIAERLENARAEAARLRGTGAELALRDAALEVKQSLGKVKKAPAGKRRKFDPEARIDGMMAGNRAVLENRLEA